MSEVGVDRERASDSAPGWGGVTWLDETGSTQDDARRAAAAGAGVLTTIAADWQRSGRGRQGRAWAAPRGSALLASIVLRPAIAPLALPPLALVIGLATLDAVSARLGVGVAQIKWPNDLLVRGRKLAGVLVEASLRGERVEWAVAGVGVNVLDVPMPPDVAARCTSLEASGASRHALDRRRLLEDLRAAVAARVPTFERAGLAPFIDELRAADATRGRAVRGVDFAGVAAGIEGDGRLRVDTRDGPVLVAAGEITFEPPA